jgi:DnaJ-class molecular chaperone
MSDRPSLKALVCRSCGRGLAGADGYCINCEPSDYDEDSDDDLECTHCGGSGDCHDGADPLGNCPDQVHPCHACGGSGGREDQAIF